MATLNVVYKIAEDIQGMKKGIDDAAKSMEKLEDSAEKLLESLKKIEKIAL